jgi:hypothetical protein
LYGYGLPSDSLPDVEDDMNVKAVRVFFVSLGVILASISPVRAQSPAEQIPQPVSASEMPPAPGAVRTVEGGWYMPADAAQQSSEGATPQAVQSTGGPDDFGYTWDDSVTFSWIEAQGGTHTGLSQGQNGAAVTAAINLGFAFKFYENTYAQLYISSAGIVGFNANGLEWRNSLSYVPSPGSPNNDIAPYLAPLRVNSGSYTGRVYYLRGGTTPNRYFVVQWHQARDGMGGQFTFQTVLYEDGTIDFNYLSMNHPNGAYCDTTSSIEDSQGLDGLAYMQAYNCNNMQSVTGKTVRFYRPASSARVVLRPKIAGSFAAPGSVAQSGVAVRNNGELGADIYDVTAASDWPVTLYRADGVTLLSDTNTNGTPDTGMISQGAAITIVVKTVIPESASPGQSNEAQLTVRSSLDSDKSKSMPIQIAVPVPFAQSYTQFNQPYASFNRVGGQLSVQTSMGGYGFNPVVATMPNGNLVQVWEQSRMNSTNYDVKELYFAVLDRFGNRVRTPAKLTEYNTATVSTYDEFPAVAVAPNGSIAIVWCQFLGNPSNSTINYNIYYMVLNSSGGVTIPATNLTNNSLWGPSYAMNVPQFGSPNIAATTNNRFVMVWGRQLYSAGSPSKTIWYAVRDSAGGTVKSATQFSTSGSTCDNDPNLAPLAGGSVFLTYSNCGQTTMGQLDSSGNILVGPTAVALVNGYRPDAVQLPNGNIVLASPSWHSIQYMVLNSSLGVVKGATSLASVSPGDDDAVSVTYAGNRAVLTWGDAGIYRPNLYYALLDETGDLLTPPMIFASDTANNYMSVPYNGQGNTYLPADTTAPTNPTSLSSLSHRVNDWSNDNTIQVYWSGANDADSGLDGYSVAWDHNAGTLPSASKTLEQDVHTLTSAALADGTWYFHIRAVDNAGNWATSAAHLGPFMIDATGPQVRGRVTNNRGEPVLNALVTSNLPARNTAHTDVAGNYTLFYTTTGVYTLTAQRTGFGVAQAMNHLTVNGIVSDVNLALPPQVEGVNGGTFENPALSAWASGGQISATVEVSAAHTGQYGLDLQSIPAPGLSSAAADASMCVTQSVVISASWQHPALSWMSRAVAGNGSQALVVSLMGTREISQSVVLTPGGWLHGWLDASGLSGQTATLSMCFANLGSPQQVYVDEVSLGDSRAGVLVIYLPQVRR